MIYSAEAYIIGPSVSSDGPHGFFSEIFFIVQDVFDVLIFLFFFESLYQFVGNLS